MAYVISRKTQEKGGHARALALTPTRRRDIARTAALARWAAAKAKKKANGSKR